MEYNVAEATKLYSEAQEESGLIYPTYEESKARFEKAYKQLQTFTVIPEQRKIPDRNPSRLCESFSRVE